VVVRVLRPDQGVERYRDLLRGHEAATEQHRAAHVDEEDGRGPGQLLGPVDLEVVGREADAGRAADRGRVLRAADRVLDRAPDVEVERVAELVRLGGLLALAAAAAAIDPVAAERVARQPGEQVVEDLLADPPAAPRRELEPLAAARQVTRL